MRLTGVSAQELCEGDSQLRLFERDVRADRLNAALDAIAARFGQGAVGPADIAPLETAEGPDDEARRRAGAARFDVDR